MGDVRLLFPHEYLSAPDLRGKDVTLTISRVFVDDLKTDKGTEKKPVMTFVELDKKRQRGETCPWKLCLNKTNAKSIAKLYGFETEEWAGKRITLYATTCLAFGQTVDCLRIREKQPASQRGQQQRRPDPEPEPLVDDDGVLDEPPDDWVPDEAHA
jgi:hypothetical protein